MRYAAKKTFDFTAGPIAGPLLMFALPLLAGNLLQQMYSITDSIIVGRLLGANALAAIGAASPVIRLSIALAIGFTLGVSVVISQYYGAHDEKNIRNVISTSYIFFTAIALVLTLIGVVFAPDILEMIDTPETVMGDAVGYLRLSFAGTFFLLGYNVSSAVYRGVGNSLIPLCMLLASTVLNIVLDLLFVIYLGMGVSGTAFATVLSQGISFLLSFLYFNGAYREYGIRLCSLSFRGRLLQRILKIGIPSGVKGSMYWLGFLLITSLVNSYGAIAVAAFSIVGKIDSFIQTPMISLSSSLSTYVGQNVGAKNCRRISRGVNICILISLVFAFVMTASVFLLSDCLMSLFTKEQEIIEYGSMYLKIVSVFYLVYVLQEVPQGVAIGCGDTIWLLLSTIFAMWVVRLPLSYILSARFGLNGIWLSMPSGWFVALIFCGGYYVSGYWRKKCK